MCYLTRLAPPKRGSDVTLSCLSGNPRNSEIEQRGDSRITIACVPSVQTKRKKHTFQKVLTWTAAHRHLVRTPRLGRPTQASLRPSAQYKHSASVPNSVAVLSMLTVARSNANSTRLSSAKGQQRRGARFTSHSAAQQARKGIPTTGTAQIKQ